MKVILSRKGFDSANGGGPSPILPDGTLLSMPIPSDDAMTYAELQYNGVCYSDMLTQLYPNKTFGHCHLDPDIRDGVRVLPVDGWQPAFGQIHAAQGVLANAGVEKGDIFLFFGWFRQTELVNGALRFRRQNPTQFYDGADLQVIYGYMQVGDILTDPAAIQKYGWHPHASNSRIGDQTNALYLPSEKLSLHENMPGCGTLDFRKDRVLTMPGKRRATWNAYDFLKPDRLCCKRKNSAKNGGLYYAGIWQELVINESKELIEWVKKILL